ncbi:MULTISPECIES: Tat pathway signal protein [Atopobiaceae]|uniref:Tat pathway signal protein n=1 Tax=Parafannyhessea umbonata TaxID=604330 RepID=A0A1H6IM70_9ACTN|nr:MULTISPECIES: Tat pathway signal protein [Atopobiaceae]SEH47617.1 hypothetical protein SAMN05216447_10371 [Parafannyhessea umbonata]SJZ68959.1 hypothetical protein SAMN06298223_1131 [Olsenella sp. KH1P3]
MALFRNTREGAPFAGNGDGRRAITRRGLFKGIGATTAVAVVAASLDGCKNASNGSGDPVVVDSESADYVIDPNTNENKFSYDESSLSPTHTWNIALGSVLRPGGGDTWIPVTTAGSSANPPVKASALAITTGKLVEVVSEPHTKDADNVVIYEACCSDSVYAWVEINLLDRGWHLYAARFSDGALTGDISTLWEASADYDPPQIACSDSRVFWLVMPNATGGKSTEHSFCYAWKAGGSSADAIVESAGRFGAPLAVSDDVLTLVPRVKGDKGTYYGITAYDLSDGCKQLDQLILPASVKPLSAVRMGDKFAFSIEANYASGGLLGNMGSYIGSADGPFVALSREPSAQIAGKGSRYFIKSSSSYFVVDTDKRSYSILAATNRSLDYGEYPSSVGTTSRFVTFCTVKAEDTGYPSTVVVRAFDL